MIPQTKEEKAEALGYQIFDTAVPQAWLDRTTDIAWNLIKDHHDRMVAEEPFKYANKVCMAREEVYAILLAGVIWEYDYEKVIGQPAPITELAEHVLRIAYPEGEILCTNPGESATETSQPSRS